MGEKLLKCYQFVGESGGLTSKMRLAMKTSIPENKAGSAPDTPENLEKFQVAVREIVGKNAPV